MADSTKMVQIGWVARMKRHPQYFGGHRARCKVYATRGAAIAGQRRGYYGLTKEQADEYVLAIWDILPAFAEVPE